MPADRTTIPINLDAPLEETAGIVLRACFYGVDPSRIDTKVPTLAKVVRSLFNEVWPRILSDIRMAGIDEAGQERLRRAFLEEAWNQAIALVTTKPLTVKPVKYNALRAESTSGAGMPVYQRSIVYVGTAGQTEEELDART